MRIRLFFVSETYNFFFPFLITILKIQLIILIKICSKKNLSVAQTLIFRWKPNLKVSLFIFNYQTAFYFCLLLYFTKNVKKLLRSFEYSKSLKAKKPSVLRPDLSFFQKKVCTDVLFVLATPIPHSHQNISCLKSGADYY